MAATSVVAVAVETTTTSHEQQTTAITTTDDNGTKAYQLVWKYKKEGSHLYRRRWNATLGQWYDPDWILVY